MSADVYVGDVAAAETAVRLPRGGTAVAVAAAASLVAATVHAAVVPEHLAHGWLHGAFLAAVAVAQVVLAWVVLRRPTVTAVILGLGGTTGVVLLYVASRTIGLPVAFGSAPESHSSHGGSALVHQPIAGTIGPGVPVIPGLQGNPGVEAVGALDLVALAAELGVLVALLALLPQRQRTVVTNVLAVLGGTLWVGAMLLGNP
ncbi:MAG: hypothetical protein WB473_12840 [Pedococcus sp.]